MRHGLKIHKIGRDASHRKATLQSMSAALIEHKRITTTLGKARALRIFVEPILHKAKDPSTAGRRQAFRRLGNKEAVKALYGEIAQAIGARPGGYTRIVKLGQVNADGHKRTDGAEMAIVEIVDFNDVRPEGGAQAKRKTRRSRGRSGTAAAPAAAVPAAAASAAPVQTAAPAAGPEALEVVDTAPETADVAQDAAAAEAVAPEAATPDDAETPRADGGAPVDPAEDAPEAVAPEAVEPDGGVTPATAAEPSDPTGGVEPPPESHATNLGRSGDRG